MIIKEPGPVTDRIVLLGTEESTVYLLKGDGEYALIGGGMTYIVPDVIKQIAKLGIDEERIKRLVFLHAHFDHCGIITYFKKRWPWAVVTASRRAKEILSKPNVVASIDFMNRALLEQHDMVKKGETLGLIPFAIDIEETPGDGDTLTCGGLSMKFLYVPGHSSCSMAVYVPEEKAMFTSDAGGIPFGDLIMTAANSNFDLYQESLEKMASYDVEVHLAEHYGARTGEEGRSYLQRSIDSASEYRTLLEESLKQTGDADESTRLITDRILSEAPEYFLPREVLTMVVGQMLKYLWSTLKS